MIDLPQLSLTPNGLHSRAVLVYFAIVTKSVFLEMVMFVVNRKIRKIKSDFMYSKIL